MANARPVHEVRLGRIKVSVWLNQGENGGWYTVTAQRLYREGEQWKTSESFSRDDLPVLCKVLDMAHTWTFQQATENGGRVNRTAEAELDGVNL